MPTLPAATEVGFLVVDIDHFKAVNDQWRDGTGDEALRVVVATGSDARPIR